MPPRFTATVEEYRRWLVTELERFEQPVHLVGHDSTTTPKHQRKTHRLQPLVRVSTTPERADLRPAADVLGLPALDSRVNSERVKATRPLDLRELAGHFN